MRNIVLGIIIGIFLVIGGYYGNRAVGNLLASRMMVSPIGKILEKPLEKYTINALSTRIFEGNQIVLDEAIATTSAYTKYAFHFLSDNKKVTGVAHVPNGKGPFPVIVQFRGYVDQEKYVPGEGTRRSAEVFAANGFLSLAPDFLGFGGSDMPSEDVFESRFETYTTALNLLASIKTLLIADPDRVGIWGHSNGGQIALTILEITGKPYPTTLWAPVSKPFPYSILYYTDEAQDHGKLLRKELAEFEEHYDVALYSLTNYLDRITAPLQIHQGTADDAVPPAWTDALAKELQDAQYFIYPAGDHDMKGVWNTVIARDRSFFQKYLR